MNCCGPQKPKASEMVLYYDDLSPSSRSCLLLIEMLKMEVTMKPIDLIKGEHLQPDYTKINPIHTVPTLVTDDMTLTDSHTILMYLCELSDGKVSKELFPAGRKERYEIYNKLFFDSNVLYRRHNEFLTELVRKSKSGGDISFHKLKIFAAYDIIDTFLKENRYIAGKKITIADIACFATISTLDLLYRVQNCANRWSFLTIWFNDMRRIPESEKNVAGLQKLQDFLEKLGTEVPKTYECPLGEINLNELSVSESRLKMKGNEDQDECQCEDDSRANMKVRSNISGSKSKTRSTKKIFSSESTSIPAVYAGSRARKRTLKSTRTLSNTNAGRRERSENGRMNLPCASHGGEMCDIEKCCCSLLRNNAIEIPIEETEDNENEYCCCDIMKDNGGMNQRSTQFNNSQGNNEEMVLEREELNKATSTVEVIEKKGELLPSATGSNVHASSIHQNRQTFYSERPMTWSSTNADMTMPTERYRNTIDYRQNQINADMTMPTDKYRKTIDYRQNGFQAATPAASMASTVPHQQQQYSQMNYQSCKCACDQMPSNPVQYNQLPSNPVQYNQPNRTECCCYHCQAQYAYARPIAGNSQSIETTLEPQGRPYNPMYSGKDIYKSNIVEILKKNGWYDDRCSMEANQRRPTATNTMLLGRTSKPTSTSCPLANCNCQTPRGSIMDRELLLERMRHDSERQRERKIEERIEQEIEKRELSRRKEKDRTTQRSRESEENITDERFIKVEPMYETYDDEELTKRPQQSLQMPQQSLQMPQQQIKRKVSHFEETLTVSNARVEDLPRIRESLVTNAENNRRYTNNTDYTQMPVRTTLDSVKEDFEEIKTFSSYMLNDPRVSQQSSQENDSRRSKSLKKKRKSSGKNKTKLHKKKEKASKRTAAEIKKSAEKNKIASKKTFPKKDSLLMETNLKTTNSLNNTSGTSLQNLNDRMAHIRKKVEEQEKQRQFSWCPTIVGPSEVHRIDTNISDLEKNKKVRKTGKIQTITAYDRNDLCKPGYTVTEEYVTPKSKLTTVCNYVISEDDDCADDNSADCCAADDCVDDCAVDDCVCPCDT